MTLTLLPQPGRRTGALIAPSLDQRPCVTHNPQWWDLGNENNDIALRLCADCPRDARCMADGETPQGVIRRGTPYDEQGHPTPVCRTCRHPRARVGGSGKPNCRCPKRTSNNARTTDTRQAAA